MYQSFYESKHKEYRLGSKGKLSKTASISFFNRPSGIQTKSFVGGFPARTHDDPIPLNSSQNIQKIKQPEKMARILRGITICVKS